jgi:hypothetical protein
LGVVAVELDARAGYGLDVAVQATLGGKREAGRPSGLC